MTVTTLQVGKHSAHSGEVCLLEAVSVLAGEDFSDTPETACPVLASFGRALNDAMPDDETRGLLLPLIPLLVGTRDPAKERTRAFYLADRSIRLYAPAIDVMPPTEIVDTEWVAEPAAWTAWTSASEATAWAATATAAEVAAWAARAATATAAEVAAWALIVQIFTEAIAL